MNKKLAIIFSILLLSLIATAFQYVEVLKLEIVKAYSATKPANGHSWTEIECTSDLCIINGKVGIGTDNPSQKLSVAGIIESTSGGIKFPDGTVQTTKTLVGPAGPAGESFHASNCVQVNASCNTDYCTASAQCVAGYIVIGCAGSGGTADAYYCYNGCCKSGNHTYGASVTAVCCP
jgi:hypothetical protein